MSISSADFFTTAYESHNDYLVRIIGWMLIRCPSIATSAEDVAQTTWLRAWEHRDRFEGRCAFRTWLVSIATNIVRGELRRRNPVVFPGNPPHATINTCIANLEHTLFAKLYTEELLRTCSSRQASALRSRFFDGGLVGAGHTDLDLGRLKVDTHRGIARIRQRIAGVELKRELGYRRCHSRRRRVSSR